MFRFEDYIDLKDCKISLRNYLHRYSALVSPKERTAANVY